MNTHILDVYPLFDITPVKALGSKIWDEKGREYLDFYGGHAVISIGHGHPHYVQKLKDQLDQISFYSNSVKIPIQEELANKLVQDSGMHDYRLFLCNSGAEANENAFKLASFHTGKKGIIAFSGGFHGRTSAAVAATDNAKIIAAVNEAAHIKVLPLNDEAALESHFHEGIAAVILEGIQGVGGIYEANHAFLQKIQSLCRQYNSLLILDEVQSGFGRTGDFFAFQHHGLQPDIISMAKGMGNGFPIGGILVAPHLQTWHGMLGTTFGGNHLACAASLAVLEVIEKEQLLAEAKRKGDYLKAALADLPGIKEIRGRGLMLGLHMEKEIAPLRKQLLEAHGIFTGNASCKYTIRLLPALNITDEEIDYFIKSFYQVCEQIYQNQNVAAHD